MSIIYGILFVLLFSSSVRLEPVNETTTAKVEAEELTPNRDRGGTPGVTSRFFGLGNILGSLFGSNRGSQGSNVFRPAVAIQRPFDRQEGWNPGFNDNGRYPNEGRFQNNQGMYPNQGGFQNFDQGRYPNQGQGQLPIQGGFGNSQSQGENFNPQQHPNQGIIQDQGQSQFPNPGIDFMNPDELPNQINLQDQGTIYDPDQWEHQNQMPNQGIQGPYPEQGQFGDQNQGQWQNQDPTETQNQGQWQNQDPTPTQSQGFLRPTQRPNWLDIGQGNYPQPGLNNAGVNNPSQSFQSQGTQTDDFSPVNFDNDGLNRQGIINNFPASVAGEFDANNSTTTGIPSNIANDSQSSVTAADPVTTQCVQDCTSTTEYNPVCGSNNITYFNGGKFTCARDCGLDIYVFRKGRCPGDIRRGLRDKITSRRLRRYSVTLNN